MSIVPFDSSGTGLDMFSRPSIAKYELSRRAIMGIISQTKKSRNRTTNDQTGVCES